MSKKNSGRRVWRGVTTATASLLALSVCASTVVDGFRTDIDKFLGTKSTKLVTENSTVPICTPSNPTTPPLPSSCTAFRTWVSG